MAKKTFAVILSGCGYLDGSEVHEATLTLWAIHKNGAEFACFAPDLPQHHVINHLNGETMEEQRNVLIESARIARGQIQPLSSFKAANCDGLILPGGFGAAKNLSSYAFDGPDMQVNNEVQRAVLETKEAGKPIGALCIAPVILAKLLPGVTLTIGQNESTAAHLTALGATHKATLHGEIAVDEGNRIVTTPCYMLDSRVDQIGAGADHLVQALLRMI